MKLMILSASPGVYRRLVFVRVLFPFSVAVRPASCKPVSVPLRATVIHLGRTLLSGSSDLPESETERAAPPPLFGLAPRGVFHAGPITRTAVRSYRTISPLPVKTGGIFSVALSVDPMADRPAVSRHAALWRPDFPPVSGRLSVRQATPVLYCRIPGSFM